jgi:hypothetical protein
MSLTRLTRLSMVAVVVAACDSNSIAPPFSLANAAATPACVGPLGEPGVAIYLGPAPVQPLAPAPPYVRIYIQQPLERLTDRSWGINSGGAQATAWYHSTAMDWEIAESGMVRVNVVASDSTTKGYVDLAFPSGIRVRTEFTAPWHPRTFLGCL